MTDFKLDERLASDTVEVCEFKLSKLLLMNDKRYPWLILVPMVDKKQFEIHHLSKENQLILLDEITKVSEFMEDLFHPIKLNVGALGNIVSQMHIHIVARFEIDDAWPKPVWGYGERERYNPKEITTVIDHIIDGLKEKGLII